MSEGIGRGPKISSATGADGSSVAGRLRCNAEPWNEHRLGSSSCAGGESCVVRRPARADRDAIANSFGRRNACADSSRRAIGRPGSGFYACSDARRQPAPERRSGCNSRPDAHANRDADADAYATRDPHADARADVGPSAGSAPRLSGNLRLPPVLEHVRSH